MDEHNFGWALSQMKSGKRVARKGWNGKGMFLAYIKGSDWGFMKDELGLSVFKLDSWIGMKTADGHFVPWLASQTDMISTDWEVVE